MKLDEIKGLVIHELRPLGPGQDSDRRGTICELVLTDIPNFEHAVNVAVRVLQRVCSLLDGDYFWSDNRDKGPSEFTEQFESWIAGEPDAKAVRICHKYWSQKRVDEFLGIMLHIAKLHGWEVEDRRADEHEPCDREEEEFLEAVEKLNPEVGQEEIIELAESYTDAAFHMNTCPWRLLTLDIAGICYCSPGEKQIQPDVYVTKNVKSINAGRVIPFKKE
jgi:hypothetical protein